MDKEVIERKLESLRRCIARIREKCPPDATVLARDFDLQDILVMNLTRAIQLCVDLGAHLLADQEVAPPATMGKTFELLADIGVIDQELATRLKKAVGFRNIAVHNYEAINWDIVFAIARLHLDDFRKFAEAVSRWIR